eukprot:3714061-Lingulodinium_polyedra.AAC.1
MHGQLWKCSVDQVRLATPPEAIGAEFLSDPSFQRLRQDFQAPGSRVGALDVAAEGPPPATAWEHPAAGHPEEPR